MKKEELSADDIEHGGRLLQAEIKKCELAIGKAKTKLEELKRPKGFFALGNKKEIKNCEELLTALENRLIDLQAMTGIEFLQVREADGSDLHEDTDVENVCDDAIKPEDLESDEVPAPVGEVDDKELSNTEGLKEKVFEYIAENGDKLKKWFSDSQITEKIEKVARKAGAVIIYPVLLPYNLFKSPESSAKDKTLIVASLAYFVLPTDLIPDFLVGLGYTDDALAISACMKKLISSMTPDVFENAKMQYKNIAGEENEETLERLIESYKDTNK